MCTKWQENTQILYKSSHNFFVMQTINNKLFDQVKKINTLTQTNYYIFS